MFNIASKFIQTFNFSTKNSELITDKTNDDVSQASQLLDELKAQNGLIQQRAKQVLEQIEKQKITNISNVLLQLYKEFQKHIMFENVHFYCHLEKKFAHDDKMLELLKEERKAKHQISRQFSHFSRKWQSQDITLDNLQALNTEFNELLVVLTQRSEDEKHAFYALDKA